MDCRRDLVTVVDLAHACGTVIIVSKPHGAVGHPMQCQTPSTGHRQRQAEATKREVARVARALFAEHGYVATTINSISAEADIPVQTIYSAFGSKAKILDKITEIWMSETQTTSRSAAYLQEPDPARQLRMLAELNGRQMQAGSDVARPHPGAHPA